MSTPFVTLDDVVGHLATLEQRLIANRDRRAVFATVYGLMSREMKRRIDARAFRDSEWVARYTTAFANLYRAAVDADDRGERVAKSWAVAFATAKQQTALVAQDLLLGINAHVNHDLALALYDVSIEPDRSARHDDHTHVNEVLRGLTDAVADRVAELYARGLAGVDACAGTLDEDVTNFSFAIARESAWEAAVALANARSEIERVAVRRLVDLRAAAMARLILVPTHSPTVLAACRKIEAGGWWIALMAVRNAHADGVLEGLNRRE